jgi:uncharacterized metal-binding protein
LNFTLKCNDFTKTIFKEHLCYNRQMSTGKVHAFATVAAGGTLSAGLIVFAHLEPASTFAFAAGCLTGLIVNPDLDIRRFTHAEAVVRSSGGRMGKWFAGLWYALWWPYSHLIPYHRHLLSHLPILGTAVRILYLAAIFALLYWLAGWLFPLPQIQPISPLLVPLFWWSFAGLSLVDALHAFMDVFF